MRQLLWMAEGHGRDEWGRLSVLLALTANCHRDPKKGRAMKPSDYDPFCGKGGMARERESLIEVDSENIGDLKVAFETMGRSRK